MNPAFHHAQPVNIFTSLMPQAFALISKSDNKTISVTKLSKRLTLDAIGKAAFGNSAFSVTRTLFYLILFLFLSLITLRTNS